MTKTLLSVALVSVFAFFAKASDSFAKTGTSLEDQDLGELNVDFVEEATAGIPEGIYWSTNRSEAAIVTNYNKVTGAAYDYEDKGTTRDSLFGSFNRNFLLLDAELPIERLVVARPTDVAGEVSNVLVKTSAYEGIYADALVKFTPCATAPDVDAEDRVVVWLRESDENDVLTTNLMVTAGRYADDFSTVVRCDYVVASPFVEADTWCRLTVRAISDVTGVKLGNGVTGRHAPGFTVYVDGCPVVADETYDVGRDNLVHADWLTPEARVLMGERRLFPWLTKPGYNGSFTLSRFSFSGLGAVDDLLFTTNVLDHAQADKVFTLQWDAGVKSLTCIVSNALAVTTNKIDATEEPRYRDYTLRTSDAAQILVTNVVYDTANGYSNGVWRADAGCTLAGDVFTYDGEHANPVGFIASSRDYVRVGGLEGCETFLQAKALAKEKGIACIELQTNLVITTGKKTGGYNDAGRFLVSAGDDVILDLMGHTLRGGSLLENRSTVYQTGGKLRITDSVGGGCVLPAENDATLTAVECNQISLNALPELTIAKGDYAGAVVVTGKTATVVGEKTNLVGVCVIDGGSFTNIYGETHTFYLEQYVTNATAYYGLDADDYWRISSADYIWCGKGADARWDNVENWRGGVVPGADDTALFPRRAGGADPWTVDFGTGVVCKKLWLDYDISMTGTNEFADVSVVSGIGRVSGTGTVTFTGKLPGALLSDAAPADALRLNSDWQGCVRIAGITKAVALTNITYWGRAGSTVEFAGVRGYLSDKANYALNYELVLTDAGETSAWRNDTGYTGSIVSFAKLSGSGTFQSPANKTDIKQVFQFLNVDDFTGTFNLGGKRLLLGTGNVAAGSGVGSFTYSDAVRVYSGRDWSGTKAFFGSTLNVVGNFEDTLMKVSGMADGRVDGVRVDLANGSTGRLEVVSQFIVIKPMDLVSIGGTTASASSLASNVKSGETLTIPEGSAVVISGNDVLVNGEVVSTVADYYRVTCVDSSAGTYSVDFDTDQATPSLADVTVSSEAGKASLTIENVKPGLWYGIQTTSSLAEDWAAPAEWRQATGGTLTLESDAVGSALFYRVIMTDKDPTGGAE